MALRVVIAAIAPNEILQPHAFTPDRTHLQQDPVQDRAPMGQTSDIPLQDPSPQALLEQAVAGVFGMAM